MTRLVAALLLAAGVSAGSVSGASPDPKDLAIPPHELSKARELIKRLGSEVYKEREEAHAELAKMGRLARPALIEAASTDGDPEIRYRCSRLLPRAGADELKARLDTFLADSNGKFEHELPGLKVYRKQVGTDEKARSLFVDIIKSPYNVEMLTAMDKGPTEAGRAISDRRTQLWSLLQNRNIGGRITPPQQMQLPDIACLLFAESVTPSKDIPRTGIFSYVTGINFLQQPASMQALNGNAGITHADAYKLIIGQWMNSREDLNDLNQLAYIAGQTLRNMPQSMTLLRKIVNTEGTYGYAKGQALMHLTQIKGKEEIPFLKKLLTNETQVQVVWFGQNGNQQPVQHQCLLKDVALAYIVTLNGHKMTDFGFKFPPGVIPNQQQIGYGNFAFENEETRQRAFVKWGFMQLKHGPTGGPPKADDVKPKDGKDPAQPVPPGLPIKRR